MLRINSLTGQHTYRPEIAAAHFISQKLDTAKRL